MVGNSIVLQGQVNYPIIYNISGPKYLVLIALLTDHSTLPGNNHTIIFIYSYKIIHIKAYVVE